MWLLRSPLGPGCACLFASLVCVRTCCCRTSLLRECVCVQTVCLSLCVSLCLSLCLSVSLRLSPSLSPSLSLSLDIHMTSPENEDGGDRSKRKEEKTTPRKCVKVLSSRNCTRLTVFVHSSLRFSAPDESPPQLRRGCTRGPIQPFLEPVARWLRLRFG